METLIGLLFILLPVIFKLIGKKLEQSGQTEKAGKIKEIANVFGEDDKNPIYDWLDGQDEPAEVRSPLDRPAPAVQEPLTAPAAIKREPVVTETVNRTTVKPMNAPVRKKPLKKPVLEEEAVVKKEKIDPKKLVIYSEIMKPKYTEKY